MKRSDLASARRVILPLMVYGGLLALFIFIQTASVAPVERTVDYSAFKALVEEGAIERVVMTPEELRGTATATAAALERERSTGTPDDLAVADDPPPLAYVAPRIDDPGLVELLDARGVPYTGAPEPLRLLPLVLQWGVPFIVLVLVWRLLLRGPGSGAASALSFGRSRAKLVATQDVGVSFADVAGVDESKEELQEVVEFLKHPERFADIGARIPKGVLLVGPPGTGKTLLARAVAGEAGVPFFSLTGSDFVEMFVGVGAARVRDLFAQAQTHAPCIIFIDELDAVGKARGASIVANEEREQTLNQLLAEMDGFDPRQGVIIMAATNRPETIDPALLRPGRFDRQILVDRPDINGREAILRVHARNIRFAPDVDLRHVAGSTPGFAGADLANVLNEAALRAVRHGRNSVRAADVQEAIERIVAGLEKRNRLLNPREKERVAHHEAGHALVAAIVSPETPVRKISIIPRGIGALGYTLQVPLEDRYLMTREELCDKLAILLAGRAAEEISFGTISTGASDDLHRATDIAARMVREYGLSERLGPLTFEQESAPLLQPLGGAPRPARYSEKTAETIDSEIGVIIDAAHTRARSLLESKREALERLANALLDRETLEGPELEALLAPAATPKKPVSLAQFRRRGAGEPGAAP
jgi:cell division protease FtsH